MIYTDQVALPDTTFLWATYRTYSYVMFSLTAHRLGIKTAGDVFTLWLTQLLPHSGVVSAALVLDSTLMTCQM